MTLYLIGLGLNDEKDITLRGLEAVKECDKVYLESYTAVLNCNIGDLKKLYNKDIIVADRDLIEKGIEKEILAELESKPELNIAILVVGDPMAATTHSDLILRAKEKGVSVKIINNASIINAIANTGLELYKFGKTTSITFPEKNWIPETCYDVIKMNKANELHTLCLLDIKVKEPSKDDLKSGKDSKEVVHEPRFMTVKEGLQYLLDIEKKRGEKVISEDDLVIGCARIGAEDELIKYGKVKDLISVDFGKHLHCIVIPGKLHFKEEEMLRLWE
ncbi:diphthine synthase [Nanoarchaeota archaeon]